MLISTGKFNRETLKGKTAIVTGAGKGIGFETARSLLWLGANVVLAEINPESGKKAEDILVEEFGPGRALFVKCDVSRDSNIKKLKKTTLRHFGFPSIIINNAYSIYIDAVHKVPITEWDKSYKTTLRAPVQMVRKFLPDMLAENEGTIVFVSSSGAAPYLGAYEVFKTAQVELSNTLSAELEDTNINVFTIGPGICKTDGLMDNIVKLGRFYNKTPDEFIEMSKNALISVEAAGAGFAAAVAMAQQYRGVETSPFQTLRDAGITAGDFSDSADISSEKAEKLIIQLKNIRETFEKQYEGWKNRSVFERQWVLRDFRKHTNNTPEFYIDFFTNLEISVNKLHLSNDMAVKSNLVQLYKYWEHQIVLLKGYEKDKQKVLEYSDEMERWIKEIKDFLSEL